MAWFYRVLRNAPVDRARRRGSENRSAERLVRELEDPGAPELRQAVCACMHDLLPSLKPEYAQVVQAVDLQERALAEVAAGGGITVNNATVRLHRARQALKKQLLRACGACAAHSAWSATAGRWQSWGSGRPLEQQGRPRTLMAWAPGRAAGR